MPKARKKNRNLDISEEPATESSNIIEPSELKPISVWAQQIKEKLGKPSSYDDHPMTITTSQTLPSPLAAIVQQNTVARMARILKEKMRAFSSANTDTLVTTCVDSSEVTFPSPVPSLGTVLAKPPAEDVAAPALTLREKYGHTYQRSYPPPKKRKHDSDDEESTSGISLWLENEMKVSKKETEEISNETDDKAEPSLQITKPTKGTTKKRRSDVKEEAIKPAKISQRGNGKSSKKSKENPKVTKKAPVKKKKVVTKKKVNKKSKGKM